jgi:hypothetical protein
MSEFCSYNSRRTGVSETTPVSLPRVQFSQPHSPVENNTHGILATLIAMGFRAWSSSPPKEKIPLLEKYS